MEGVHRARIDEETDEPFVSLRRPLGVESLGMNQMVLRPGQRFRIHRHVRQTEIYLVLRGALTLELEGEELLTLGPGELASVAPNVRRQLSNRGDERVVLVALGGAGQHEGRDGEAFLEWSDTEPKPPSEVPLPPDLS